MKKFTILLFAILVVSVSSTAIGSDRPELIKKAGSHHGTVLTIAAFHFCALNRWPTDMQEIQSFRKKHLSHLKAELDWEWLQSKEVSYKYEKSYALTSQTPDGENEIIVFKSKQLPPTCKDGNTELNGASVNLE